MCRAVLGHDAREAPQYNLDPRHYIDAAARAVHVTHADRDALDGARVPRQQLAEPSPDLRAIVVVQSNPIDPDVRAWAYRRSATDTSGFGGWHL
jgi:hypothetical protein